MYASRKRQKTPEPPHLLLEPIKPEGALWDALGRMPAFADHFGPWIACFDEFVHGVTLVWNRPMAREKSAVLIERKPRMFTAMPPPTI
jgi:hypothetical protein